MNQRERLMATLEGEPVDRPAVSFYEINGLDENPDDQNPYNIYNHPSWRPLIQLAKDHTDRIVMRDVPFLETPRDLIRELITEKTWVENGSSYIQKTMQAGKRQLTQTTRRDVGVNTVWQVEHLLKDLDDLKAFMDLPWPEPGGIPDTRSVFAAEASLGESGIVMIDTGDPICAAAALFDLGTYTVLASTEPEWFRKLLEVFASELFFRTQAVATTLPGRLWRIYGAEYASPPYLHPKLFREYVTVYDREMVKIIQSNRGYARIHCHGKLRLILDEIRATGCMGIDPIEPPPQGDVELKYVRDRYGDQMVLFGNLEASDLENLPTDLFEQQIRKAIREGTGGAGRGFVLMPSSCPYGRELQDLALRNYQKMIEVIETG
jgi:hypothetical protein